jgi:hypothetical protein
VRTVEVVAPLGREGREIAADEEFVVGLEGDGADLAVGIGVVGGVERAVDVEAGDVVALGGADNRKGAGDDELAVGLAGDREHAAVGRGGGKRGVDRAVGVEAGEVGAGEGRRRW